MDTTRFDELPLEYEILDGLEAMNFTEATPVQAQAIPVILQGDDVIACAQTGTGKTAAFILPLLNNLLLDRLDGISDPDDGAIHAIIMAPTRELAQQIDKQLEGFSYFLPFSSVPVYGGNDGQAWSTQKTGLTKGADIVVATPGRLISHINIYDIDFSKVRYFILDEADRMLDMGFYDDIMQIVKQLPRDRQTIMFSATMPPKIKDLAKTIMYKPREVKIAVSRPPESIMQSAYVCYENQKIAIIQDLFRTQTLHKVVLFVGKKLTVKEVVRALRRIGVSADEMHSDLTQQQRDHVMHEFRNGRVDILVATDIVARGIDIDDIPLVINYDVPDTTENYVHRIGRTARAANKGMAITLVSERDQAQFLEIEKFLEKEIYKIPIPTHLGEAPEYKPQERRDRRGGFAKRRMAGGNKKRPFKKRNNNNTNK